MITNKLSKVIAEQYTGEPALLIGNGINRVTHNSLSWEEILKNLIKKAGTNDVRAGYKPLTFLFEEILHSMDGGATRKNEKMLKEFVRIAIEEKLEPNHLHKKITSLPVKIYLTTNYDYCFEKAIDINFTKPKSDKAAPRSSKYSLTRHNKVMEKFIWHIHGELDNGYNSMGDTLYEEKSIMLGFDQYVRNLIEMTEYLNSGHYRKADGIELEKTFEILLQKENNLNKNWISFFFTHNIHIFGLELGLFETHLWWLLNYRAKLACRKDISYKNNITCYVPSYELLLKRDQLELLKSLKVEIKEVDCKFNNGNFYEDFYLEVYKILAALANV